MKKLYSIVAATGLVLAISGCTGNTVTTPEPVKMKPLTLIQIQDEIGKVALKIDVKEVCDIQKSSMKEVLSIAEVFNNVSKLHGVEFKRLGMTNTQYIDGATTAMKTGAKKVVLLDKKGKPTKNSVSVSYAVERACKFAVSALTQEEEGKTTWRAAVPGDGFKY